MAPAKGAAAYKKKDGTVVVTADELQWTPVAPRGAPPAVAIAISDITNLQQTPETVAKVMLKVIANAETFLFHFNAPVDPRGEANVIKDALTKLITVLKASASVAEQTPKWFDDAQLKQDIELQLSLMKKDPHLHRTYMESKRTKPDSISDSHFNAQFWSTRTNLLRAHAVERHQQRGSYNVLSAVKPRQVDGELKLSISKEQIQLIFSQHPLVKRVYDANVPKVNEAEFWSRFFLSRLFKKLKGERITDNDTTDAVFDKYLDAKDDEVSRQVHIPHIIDIEANEENQSVRTGNRKDWTMRPSKVPIVKTLNSLSEKIMANVAPSDTDTYDQLALRDLQGDATENRIMLNVKAQSFVSETHTPSRPPLTRLPTPEDLRRGIGFQEDSDSEDEKSHVGSRASLMAAQTQILAAIARRRTQMAEPQSDLHGLSSTLFDRLTLTHATTTEFLHHFWALFLSGDPDKAGDLALIVDTLGRAMERINAVAADAEAERKATIQKQKQHIREIWERTGKKMGLNAVGGGEQVVREMMEPTIQSLAKATREYRKALAAEAV